jgi:glutaredoxin
MDLDKLEYIVRPGVRNDHDIVVYALSTCGFCRRALAFLDERGFRYRFIYVDLIPIETKNEIKATLKARFDVNVAFPFAVVDGKQHLIGFIEPDWVRTLDAQG